jgi:hypothetical protein
MPHPSERQSLTLSLSFTHSEVKRLRNGHVPFDMDDKWFIYAEDDWLYFHRSWTGACIFGLRLDPSGDGARIEEGWVSRDREQYNWRSVSNETALLHQLIRNCLLS